MKPHWVATLACVCATLGTVLTAAVPTPDTMVVARSEDAKSTPSLAVTEAATTEGPAPPIKLTEMVVDSVVALRYAHTAVVAKVKNPAKKAQEAHFRVLLPETAFISGFTMILDGKPYKAYVKEKEEAKQIYDQAVSQGVGAAHIAAKARDSNHFTVSVNVEPNTTAVFNLTYEELLSRRNGVYNHAINLHPGALVPKLEVTVKVKEAQKISQLRVPEVRTGNEVDATEDDASNQNAAIERGHDDREATIKFKPDIEEQKRLMEIYAQKTKESQSQSSRWRYGGEEEERKPEGVLGQFVVQYDVERPEGGEVLVNDGYFVHFFAPTSLPPLNKHVVFVLDTSGSMMDRKIEQLRQAMQTILSELNKGDYFNIVEFASSVMVHDLQEADKEPPKQYSDYSSLYMESDRPTKLVAPSQATPDNVAKAKVIVSRLIASGGTNIDSALSVAVDLIRKGINSQSKPTANDTKTDTSAPAAENKEVAKAEDTKKDDENKLEPIIIFLTDGDPTVGITDPLKIINRLTEKNSGRDKASIFSLAFGEDADRKFLRKLSLRSDGFMRHIYEAADAALQLHDFYRQVSSPLLAHVKFSYPADQVKEGSLTKNKFRTIYAGSETVVAGRLTDAAAQVTPQLEAFCGVQDGNGRKKYEIFPKVPVAQQREGYLPLERLWAYLTIKQLLDERDAAEDDEDKERKKIPEKKALDIALKYEFVTPLTSLVVVKPNATKAVDAESVDKQSDFVPPLASHNYAFSPALPGLPGAPGPASYLSLSSDALSQHSMVVSGVPMYEAEDIDFDAQFESDIRPSSAGGFASSMYGMSATKFAQPMAGSAIFSGSSNVHRHFLKRTDDIVDKANRYPSTAYMPMLVDASTTFSPAPVDIYHLQGFEWLLDHLRQSGEVEVNSTLSLKLTSDINPPKDSAGDVACTNSVEGATGVCVYLTRCDAARSITFDKYASSHCVVENQYAGVCCPHTKVDLKKITT